MLTKPAYVDGMNRLWANFPARGNSEADKIVALETYWTEISKWEWIEDVVWKQAISSILVSDQVFFPTIKQLLTWTMEADKENDKRILKREEQGLIADAVVAEAINGGEIPELLNTLQSFVDSGGWDRHWAFSVVSRRLQCVPTVDQIDEELHRLFERDAMTTEFKDVRGIDGKRRPVRVRVMRGRIEDALAFRTPGELPS